MTPRDGGTGPAPAIDKASHHGRPIGAVARSLALVVALLFLGGCTIPTIIDKTVSVVAKPVLGLAVKDAQTTLAWVEREEKAGRLLPVVADAAKKCPEAVIALDALRTRMSEGAAGVEGFRGLIYYGTLNRYGQGVQAEAGRHLEQLAQDCLPLIPAEKLMGVF
jgi:hypothetical protein